MRDIGQALKNARHKDVVERFWSRTKWVDGCRIWLGACHEFGYGVVGIGKLTLKTHRVAWWLARGPIPNGMHVLHHCDNPPCVNPEHLFLGTIRDNNLDAIKKGRLVFPPTYRGEANNGAKLTARQVRSIRLRLSLGERRKALAAHFGVGISAINRIATGTHWKNV